MCGEKILTKAICMSAFRVNLDMSHTQVHPVIQGETQRETEGRRTNKGREREREKRERDGQRTQFMSRPELTAVAWEQ